MSNKYFIYDEWNCEYCSTRNHLLCVNQGQWCALIIQCFISQTITWFTIIWFYVEKYSSFLFKQLQYFSNCFDGLMSFFIICILTQFSSHWPVNDVLIARQSFPSAERTCFEWHEQWANPSLLSHTWAHPPFSWRQTSAPRRKKHAVHNLLSQRCIRWKL